MVHTPKRCLEFFWVISKLVSRIDPQAKNSGGLLSQSDFGSILEIIVAKEEEQRGYGIIGGMTNLRRCIHRARKIDFVRNMVFQILWPNNFGLQAIVTNCHWRYSLYAASRVIYLS
ncbi:hypothetical protein OCU04_003751 [Sclerotinia nivalis]|uniref:Uncharacterized protein n=1 Tax=Sclerotinia nivalis TaxID=352851 RepID=A0A9X0ASJ3_9HELO|nr:hypothetical protein OCU04_003751 [Sclerotinia nivalis]